MIEATNRKEQLDCVKPWAAEQPGTAAFVREFWRWDGGGVVLWCLRLARRHIAGSGCASPRLDQDPCVWKQFAMVGEGLPAVSAEGAPNDHTATLAQDRRALVAAWGRTALTFQAARGHRVRRLRALPTASRHPHHRQHPGPCMRAKQAISDAGTATDV
jgi:hypothetical protein